MPGNPQADPLLEVNERLLLAVLNAETLAEDAAARLGELTRASQRDALTDLPNRALMMDRLQSAIALAKRRQTRAAVLFVDLDHFKRINDTFGHSVGDEVLQRVARALEAAVRESDTVSRHSGDEFLVLLSEIAHPSDAALIAWKMLASIASISEVDGLPMSLSASMGIAIYPDHGGDVTSLVSRADAAMYRSKKKGGARIEFHADALARDAGAAPPFEPMPLRNAHAGITPPPDAPDPQVRELREANEQLVLSSLAAQEQQAETAQLQLRHVKFLATVAHELRNPLATLRLAVDLLGRVRNDEQQHARAQEMIRRQVSHLARIVDDLLDSSRVEIGNFNLQCSDLDLAEILELAIESCRPAMDGRLQQLTVRLPDAALPVCGDPVRLAQVFRNLLDNASKYTPTSGLIALSAERRDQSIVTTIADTGIGISSEALPHIFKMFVQDPRAIAVHGGGLGIGLAVVRELVNAHGGTVTASSGGPDLGSTFVVTLPALETKPGLLEHGACSPCVC